MTIVDKYLKEFVLNNRRVIIPDLGAFLLKENPSGEKSIVFSSFLRYNDGFLEEALMQNAQVNKTQATSAIKKFVNEAGKSIRNKRRYEIENFGYFTHDDKGAVQFIPSLETIQALNPVAVTERKIEEQTQPLATEQQVTETIVTNEQIIELVVNSSVNEPTDPTVVEKRTTNEINSTIIPTEQTIGNSEETIENDTPQNPATEIISEIPVNDTIIEEPTDTIIQNPTEETVKTEITGQETITHNEPIEIPIEVIDTINLDSETKEPEKVNAFVKAEEPVNTVYESQITSVIEEEPVNQTAQQPPVTNAVNNQYINQQSTARTEQSHDTTDNVNNANMHLATLYQNETKKRTRLLWVIIVLLIIIVAQLVLLFLCVTDSDYCILRKKTAIVPASEQTLVMSEEQPTLVNSDTSDIHATYSTPVSTGETLYYVIAGCFSEKINAERFLKKSVSEGYESAELLPKFGDLYPVSVNKSYNSNEAENLRDIYNARHDAEAWVHPSH